MAPEPSRFLPSLLDQIIAAFDDVVEIDDLHGNVIDAGTIGAMAKKQLVVVGFGLAL